MIRPVMSKIMICCGTIAALAGCKTQKAEQKTVEEAPATPAFESEDTSLAGAATPAAPGPAAEGDLNAIIAGAMKDTKSAAPMPEAAASFSQSSAAAASYVTPTEKRDRFGNVYKLDSLGNLYRYFGGTLKCQVTNNVLDFKINMHPADEAIVYLVRNEGYLGGVLYALMDSPTYGDSQCPKSNSTLR